MSLTASQALILGSAPDVVRARGWARDGLGAIVAINNAWGVRPDWDWLIHPSDFPPERRPPAPGAGQGVRSYEAYVPAVNTYGGFVYAGGTMAFTAAYWTLNALRPQVMAFLGCDMVYARSGASHFYGRGSPIRCGPIRRCRASRPSRRASCSMPRKPAARRSTCPSCRTAGWCSPGWPRATCAA